ILESTHIKCENLDVDLLKGLHNLEELGFEFSRLKELDPKMLAGLTNLKSLSVNENELNDGQKEILEKEFPGIIQFKAFEIVD
ncbi:unnamed protein product, partial [Brachionus calyciflorus]